MSHHSSMKDFFSSTKRTGNSFDTPISRQHNTGQQQNRNRAISSSERFIPNRYCMNMDLSRAILQHDNQRTTPSASPPLTSDEPVSKREKLDFNYRRVLSSALLTPMCSNGLRSLNCNDHFLAKKVLSFARIPQYEGN